MKKLIILISLSISLTAFASQKIDTTVIPKPDTATQNLINIEQSAVFTNTIQYVQQNFQNLTIKEVNTFADWLLKLLTNSATYYFQELEKKKPPKK